MVIQTYLQNQIRSNHAGMDLEALLTVSKPPLEEEEDDVLTAKNWERMGR